MQAIHATSTVTYWITGDGEQVVHFGTLQPGQNVTTGQPAVYATEIREQWVAQLVRLGVTIGEDGEPVPLGGTIGEDSEPVLPGITIGDDGEPITLGEDGTPVLP